MSLRTLRDLRVADVITFLAVRRRGSVSAAARELRVTPSQVSKAVERLGDELGHRLLSRTGRGITLTEHARGLAPHLEDIVVRLERVQRGEAIPPPELAVAAPSYLISNFLPHIAAAQPRLRVRGIELGPSHIRAYATERFFDIALTPGTERLPEAWVTRSVGVLRKALFASPRLAKRLRPFPVSVDRIREVPFVGPIYFADGHLVPTDDDCPLGRSERRLGHEAQTIGLALELAARTDQLAFGPVIASRSLVERGLLVEVPVKGWNVSDALQVACHQDRVLAAVQTSILRTIERAVGELSEPVGAR